MAFFKKLKERLFRSSSKIDEGLEAIVSDGGEEETVDAAALEAQEAEARAAEEAAAAEAAAQAAREAAEAAAQEAEAQALRDAAEQAAQEAEARRLAEEQAARDAAAHRRAEEQAASEAEAKRAADEHAAQEAAAQRAAEEQAAQEAAAQRAAEEQAAQEAAAQRAAEEQAARAAEAERAAQAQAAHEAAEREAKEAAQRAEAARLAQAAADAAQRAAEEAAEAQAEAEAQAAQEAAAEAAREAAELAAKEKAAQEAAERAAQAAAAQAAADAAARETAARQAAQQQAQREAAAQRAAQEQAERDAAAARAAEAQAAREAEAKQRAEAQEAARQAEAERKAEADRQAEAERVAAAMAAQEAAETERAAEAAAQAAQKEAEAKAAAQAIEDEETPRAAVALRTSLTPVAPDLIEETPAEPEKKPGFFGRLIGRAAPKTIVRRALDDDMLEQLEELLITADMGVDTALRVTANMAEGRFGKKLSVAEIKELMASEVARIMEPVAKPLPLYAKTPQVVLVVGVNGSGKTTTIGKLASQFRAAGKKVVIAAGDTFRAAAVEQLQVWGDRAGVPVLTAPQGTDPASLAFDALAQAQADGADLLMIDTAGRLQNRGDLMEELAKIVRVIRKKDETAPHNTLLVLDATTGQNALNQVKVFQEISDVSGLVMTKLDGTAKGGVLVALADKFGLPIHAIGVGEQIDDLSPFDPQEFADALVGLER